MNPLRADTGTLRVGARFLLNALGGTPPPRSKQPIQSR